MGNCNKTSQNQVFDPTAKGSTNTRQREETFSDFEELSKLCVLGGKRSAMCLLRSTWLQEKREEVRNGVRFVLPSRNRLPREAVYSGRIAEDSTFIIVLSYCWASPEHPDPENRLLANVCEFLAYLDVSRHFGSWCCNLIVADREVLVFWDWPCLYQKKDGATPLQLDSFKRGLLSVNVLYGHVETLCLLCTEGHFPPGSRPDYKGSGWPYFESLVSTLVKDENKAVDLPRALEWVRTRGVNTTEPDDNRSIFWLYQHVRRAERQLPVSPDVFDREIEHKRVTNGNDKQVLKDKFRDTFVAVMQPAKKISLKDVPGPSSTEWRLFLQDTLRWCPRLQHIDLSCNESIAGATLEPFAGLGATLEVPQREQLRGVCGHPRRAEEPSQAQHPLPERVRGFGGQPRAVEESTRARRLGRRGVFWPAGRRARLGDPAEAPDPQHLGHAARGGGLRGGGRLQNWAVGRNETPLWFAAHAGQAHTARRLLEGTVHRRGVEVDRATTDNGNHAIDPGRMPRVPRCRQGPPPAPRGREQGEERRFHAVAFRCAEGVRGGG